MHCNADVGPLRGQEVLTEACLGGESDNVQYAVHPTPFGRKRLAHVDQVFGVGDVEFEHIDGLGQLACRALREAEGSARAGEHDVGALLLRQHGNAVGKRGIREDAGDHDVLAVEQTHVRHRNRTERTTAFSHA